MGVRSTPKERLTMCVCATLGLALLILAQHPQAVKAGKQGDADLTFEQLEDLKLNHKRINRHTSVDDNVDSQSSHNWFLKTANKVKRDIWDSWSNWITTTTTTTETPEQEQTLVEENSREEFLPRVEDNDYEPIITSQNVSKLGLSSSYTNSDDEDLYNSGEHSGMGEKEHPSHGAVDPEHKAYFRIRFTAMEPYEEAFTNKDNIRYRRFAEEIEDNIDRLYLDLPGTQISTVISIQKRASDTFTSLITIDLQSKNYYDMEGLRNKIYNQIKNYHTIGSLAVQTDDFNFRDFGDRQQSPCWTNELPCRSGECVPAEARCNGISECPDNSDEEGCGNIINEPDVPEIENNPGIHTETKIESNFDIHTYIGGGDGNRSENPLPTNATFTSTTFSPHVMHPTGRCRADDVVTCPNSNVLICSEQECDGTQDCPNGEDEYNCPDECAEGELGCDISRCIPEAHRCDGKIDCDDETDERDCPKSQCQAGQFRCDNGNCIDHSQRCDGRHDCGRGEDEVNCPERQGTKRCESTEFTCGDGFCIAISKRCDEVRDCRDGSDEKYCPCKSGQFTCANGFCIPERKRCDSVKNCQDGSDEWSCTGTQPVVECEKHQRRCNDGTCLDQISFCNGKFDCKDKSDEMNCCLNDQYRCSNGTCLTIDKVCDGRGDCEHSEDEDNCVKCRAERFWCENGDCINHDKWCDTKIDCKDGSDERYCRGSCAPNEFQCGAGFCIMGYKRCNGYKDCLSGNDEDNCPNASAVTCGPNQFRCNDGQCIESSFRCDKIDDCLDESDELNCSVDCNPGLHRCNDGHCMNATLCDGTFDCFDGSDEADCDLCAPYQFRCFSGGCVPEEARCDGTIHCTDSSDEKNCVHRCASNEFTCGNGVCVDDRRVCDGYHDCYDQSDEHNCSIDVCRADQYRCNSSGLCIDAQRLCDGYPDCVDQSDEYDCPPTACTTDQFQCNNGICINAEFRCDQLKDCDDGSDEVGCSQQCNSDEFQCGENDCIPLRNKCDGTKDCENGIDEYDCPQTTHKPCSSSSEFSCSDGSCIPISRYCDGTPDCRDHSDERDCGTCQHDEFECYNGQCIAAYLRCNKRSECSDNSDEQNCPTEAPPVIPEQPFQCPRGQQPCRTGNQCYSPSAYCDNRVDCNDFSDEDNCSFNTKRCDRGEFRCENGPCIPDNLRCDGKVDCPMDSSDELDCGYHDYNSSRDGLNLKTYPDQQEIKESREVVFQCRDEGPLRAKVHWSRANNLQMPYGYRDHNGRLEMPNIQLNHSGTYICSALGYPPSTPGAQVKVILDVNPYVAPTARPPIACGLYESTCSNGDCISKNLVCDGKYDCTDGSDETRCNAHGCEPNEFRCANKRCILKTWRCDSDDDCGDNSDEMGCATNPPGSPCEFHQYACRSGNQCIPKSFHCDQSNDCADGSDEIGCSHVTILRPPPPMMQLQTGETFIVTCTAVGVPTPEIVWRLNWGHIPEKCSYTSINGIGTLTCPDIQESDQGAYSCEGINIKGSIIATPDTILMVGPRSGVCPKGFFNEEARTANECISCFCFGVTKECSSADLFTYHLQPPFDAHKFVGVKIDSQTGMTEIRDEPIYKGAEPRLTPVMGKNGVHAQLDSPRGELAQHDVVPYFAMPENYHGNQLKSYGGFIKYSLTYEGYGRPISRAPDVILTGNGYTLLHMGQQHQPSRKEDISVRFFVGEWMKRSDSAPESLATREEIMMTLASVENILIKLQYVDGHLDTTLENIEMDSAAMRNTGLGQAIYVEECRCPVGYSGLSCEACAPGYSRHRSGPWLGQCYKEVEACPPGYYGDPSRGIQCQICPCPLTNPGNQFARTCHLDSDGDVTCDCPAEYVGRRCETCAHGYSGNPLMPGDYCKPATQCSIDGAEQTTAPGECRCKANTDGPTCNSCKKNTFHLSAENQFGCISCFCMGITDQCSSSNWYRSQLGTVFTTSKNNFKLVESNSKHTQIEDGIILDPNSREIVYRNFRRPDVYYWSLPPTYLGDKVEAYGGYLRYTLRYVPTPGGQSSKNNAPDVELISDNHITLTYFAREHPSPNSPQTFTVPLLEQYWQRHDGQKADREHLMMALADVKAILIKATYTTNTREVALQSVSLDIAEERNTGGERALTVEQCYCPVGYKGLSCEDCDAGYKRTLDGIYLGRCEKCECNGHSNECDSESGECFGCRDHTTGQNCEQCESDYEGDPANRIPCRYVGGSSQTCICDPNGSISNDCIGGVCQCKTNVEGNRCDRCREGTFGLNGSIAEGCQSCFCSGVATECRESNLYIEQIPSQIFDQDRHGFILTDQNQRERITNNFQLNVALNEIGYNFRPSNIDRLFWSLPSAFTGHKIKSYGGKLEFTQRYTQRPDARYMMDQDVIIIGNGITIYWTNPYEQSPNIANKVSVILSPVSKWQRLDYRQGPRPASREDILKVLSNVQVILIRAQLSSDTASSFISDLTLDTAVEQPTGQAKATNVEVCLCPSGYSGTSCELCAAGYYRDINDLGTGPLGSCSRCPCNGNELSCNLGPDNRVVCNCLPTYKGRTCEISDSTSVTTPAPSTGPIPAQPTITVSISSPQLTIKEVGGEVRFICSARSTINNNVRLQWAKAEGSLPERAIDDRRGLLVITDLRVSDSGNYICQANDGISIVTEHVNLAVGSNRPEAPTTQIYPSYLEVNEGEPIEMQCSATGNPTPTLHWTKVTRDHLNPRHTFTNGVYRINNAIKSDEGEYECTAINSAGNHTSRTIIYVKDVVGSSVRPIITPPHYTGTSGQSFTLTCEAGGPQQDIIWSKQGGYLPYSSRDENGILIVSDAKPEDSGIYICTVTNYLGAVGTANTNVNIIPGNTGVYPSIKIEPTNQRVTQGSNIEIHCEAQGSPTPNIKWTRLGDVLPSHVVQTEPTLKLYNIQVSDRGVYICVANNNLGLAQASSVLEVDRRESPVIEIHPKHSQSVTAGGSALIQCHINAGIPHPTIRWHRPNGEPLSTRIEQLSNGVLRFPSISEAEGGEYICTAENAVGKVTAIGSIVVQTPPTVMVNPPGESLTVQPGEFVRLECSSSGVPTPTVQWNKYRPDSTRSYPSDSRHLTDEIPKIAVYEITSATPDDTGTYICLGRNNAGAEEKRIQLYVDNRGNIPARGDITGNRTRGRGEDPGSGHDYNYHPTGRFKDNERPRPNVVDEQTFTVPAGNNADLRCNIKNDVHEQIYTNWVRADNSSLPQYSEISEGTLIIKNAQPSDAGEYQCLGISSETGTILFIVTAHVQVLTEEDMCALQAPPRITLNPPRQVVRPGDNAMIECSATGEQPITITWSGLNRTMPESIYARDGFLRFHGIQLSDAGRYRCTAINSVGEADAVAEVLVQETIHQPPIVAKDREQTALSGTTVSLHCSVRQEFGSHDVRWFRENDDLPSNSRTQGNQLQIHNIQAGDAGKYYCEISTDAGTSTDYINLHISSPATRPPTHQGPPSLDLQASTSSPRIGENLQVYCRSSEPGVITTWTKLSGRIADNVQISGGTLRINHLRPENGGVYRCEARGYDGFYHKDHLVDIMDEIRKKDIAIKKAPQGSTVILDCKTDLDEPVTFMWNKQKGVLPRDVDVHARSIQLNDVGSNDAGTYTCTSTNAYKTTEIPTILLITGIVPHFTQTPSSFIGLPPLPDSYLQFNIDISFKPLDPDGLILYNGNKKGAANGDFISLTLNNGIPEFRFNLGHNTSATVVAGDRQLTMGKWHNIKISRMRRKGTMYVNGEGPFTATAASKYSGLTLSEPLFLGGAPKFDEISPHVNAHKGLVGCISRLKIGHAFYDITKEAQLKKGVTSCETCSENPCYNHGVCQEALTKEGFSCICPAGYSGSVCNKVGGESCTAHTCGTGRCIDTDDSYSCLCPLGRVGRNCEREIEITEPAFSKNAYVAYPTPVQLRRLKVSMKIKPRDLNDGVIAYCGENEEGDGDFVSLAVKDRRLEFRFDVGNGPTVIRSNHDLVPNNWVVVTASRMLNEGRLIVNGDVPVIGRSVGNHRALNLHTPFYVGGFDKDRIKLNAGVDADTGFHGCISEVSVSSVEIHLIHSVEDSANVQDCSTLDENLDDNSLDNDLYNPQYAHENPRFISRQTGCSSNPCRNEGQCYPLSPVNYKCSCVNGYSGIDCEIAPNLCDQLTPCQNKGICHGNTTQYVCDCLKGFTGINCETNSVLRNDVNFNGNGYLEFKRDLLPHGNEDQEEVIALELSTNDTDGLIFWHGQKEGMDGYGEDYIALAVRQGFLEFSYDLGTGAAIIYNDKVYVSDGLRHKVILKRRGRKGSIEVDNDYFEEGESLGPTSQFNFNGNIYLGGTPNVPLMTGRRFVHGFNGCIHGFELQDSRTLDLGLSAVSGLNVKACYRSNKENSIYKSEDEYDEEISN